MRFHFLLVLLTVVFWAADAQAQSGARGSGSRRPAAGGGGGGGIVSRVGGARNKTVPLQGSPTGLMNSANAARRSGGGGGGGSSYRPSSARSSGGGAYPSGGVQSRRLTGSGLPPSRSKKSSLNAGLGSSPNFTFVDGMRTWQDATGKYSVQGKLAAHRGEWVWIRRSDGQLAKLRLQQLSSADQQFVSTQ